MKDTHSTDLQLNNKYTVNLDLDIQLGSSFENTEFDVTEKYEDMTLVDLETEEVFKLKQLLPPLRHELEYLIKNKVEAYIASNWDKLLIELAPNEWLQEQQEKEESDSGCYRH